MEEREREKSSVKVGFYARGSFLLLPETALFSATTEQTTTPPTPACFSLSIDIAFTE